MTDGRPAAAAASGAHRPELDGAPVRELGKEGGDHHLFYENGG